MMDGATQTKMPSLARRCANIVLFRPTEKTSSALVAILASGGQSFNLYAADSLALVRDFKTNTQVGRPEAPDFGYLAVYMPKGGC